MPSRAVPSGDSSIEPLHGRPPRLASVESLDLVFVPQDVCPARPLEIHTRRLGVLSPQTTQEHIKQAAEGLRRTPLPSESPAPSPSPASKAWPGARSECQRACRSSLARKREGGRSSSRRSRRRSLCSTTRSTYPLINPRSMTSLPGLSAESGGWPSSGNGNRNSISRRKFSAMTQPRDRRCLDRAGSRR